MSMTRAQLVATLWGRLQGDLTAAGISNDDSTGNLKEPIDDTLLALGVAYADLETTDVATGSEAKAIVLGRYYALEVVYEWAKGQIDIQVDAPNANKKRSQFFDHIKDSSARAKAAADPFIPTTSEGTWGFGTISLGYIEPTCAGEYA